MVLVISLNDFLQKRKKEEKATYKYNQVYSVCGSVLYTEIIFAEIH